MAWETIILKVQESRNLGPLHHKQYRLCPRCEGKLFTIPFVTDPTKGIDLKKFAQDIMEFQVLTCDRCGQFLAFEGCTGECASVPRSKCEVCGKFYCSHCGISIDTGPDQKHVALHYCNDHVPEWYKNR